ncbi:MAG: 2Fe-2S iron-sulfur cluster-binding protein [Gemmatimonadaceae bacterium]|nr:2Fe-2S iron-sulfur cluster-binding protein [Gemmatimonadaceae bacterium]
MTAPAAPAPAVPGMITLSVEGRTVSVPPGTSILEAAKHAGVLVPHYCYHPSLPVAGVCRMCLVEVEKFPKLAPACATAVGEGQVVHVHSEKAREARKGVLEFLLINHPLDCPICDQAGECELQDYTFAEGRKDSRYLEPKRFNPMEDFGGDVLYVPNRCILCTRCVRFMDTVAHEPVLNVSERGDRAFIGIHEGQGLTHEWAGNVVDLCPVGALLSKDFLNKARAWELDRTASVCTGCSQGCNMMIETRDETVVRLRPRPNAEVNAHFMCNTGRLGYRTLNRRDRLEYPMARGDGALGTTDWMGAITVAAARLRGAGRVVVLASPSLSNEALFVLGAIADAVAAEKRYVLERGPEAPLAGVRDLALRAERAANHTGATLFGFAEVADPFAGLGAGDVLLAADELLAAWPGATLPAGVTVVVAGTVLPGWAAAATVAALPTASYAEQEGTLTNLRGRVQRFLQATTPPGQARPTHLVLGELAAALGVARPAPTAGAVFDRLAETVPAFAGLRWAKLGLRGLPILADAGAPA